MASRQSCRSRVRVRTTSDTQFNHRLARPHADRHRLNCPRLRGDVCANVANGDSRIEDAPLPWLYGAASFNDGVLELPVYRFSATVVFACALTLAPVSAATLHVTQGNASVNRGQGFDVVNGTATVNPGDVVNVPPGSNALVVYPDGSIQTIQPGNIASVGPGTSAPASGLVTMTQAVTPAPNPAPAGGIAGAGGGVTGTTIAVGAAAVGVGIGVAAYAAQAKGASP